MLTGIKIKNFMGIKEAEIRPHNGVNLFLGKNAQGKSSLMWAIIWALIGSINGLKQKDKSMLVNLHGKRMSVEVESPKRTLKRTLTSSTSSGKGAFPAVFTRIWGNPCELLSFLTTKDGKELLQSIVGKTPGKDDVINYLKNKGISLKAINSLSERLNDPSRAQEEAINLRREVKRIIAELEKKTPPMETQTVSGKKYHIADMDLKNLEKQKARLEKELNDLQEKVKRSERIKMLKREEKKIQEQLVEEKKLRDEVDKLNEELDEIRYEFENAICPINDKPCPTPEFVEPGISNLKEKLNRIKTQLNQKQQKLAYLEEKRVELMNIKNEIESIGGDIEEVDDGKIKELQNRLQTGSALIQTVKMFWQEMRQYEETRKRIGELQAEVQEYDKMAKALDPVEFARNFRNDLPEINQELSRYGSFLGLNAKLTDDFEIEVEGRPFIGLSRSEKYRLGAAFAIVLAKRLGSKLLMFDDAEVLVKESQVNFLNLMLSLESEGFQTFIFASSKTEKPQETPIPTFWVEDGRVEKIPINLRKAA